MLHKSNCIRGILLLVINIFFLMTCVTYAQGKIVGKVIDTKTREPLFGVSVIIGGTNMGAATDPEGDYIIVNVPVGTYSLSASMVGASKITKTKILVSSGQTTRIDFELEETALMGQDVVVTARRDILHKEVSSSQTVITSDQIVEAAGVNTLKEYLSTQAGITGATYLTIRGGNPQETGTMVNGIPYVNTRQGMSQAFIPTSSIEQVSLRSGGMTAEYGEFRSGVIDVTAKSGTKDGYHGSFSFTRNQAQLKRFGKSMYDPMSNGLRPHLDPDIAFIGVNAAKTQGIISAYDAQQFFQNAGFTGFKAQTGSALPAGWRQSLTNKGLNPLTTITAVDLYLYDAWMHQVMPDFNKLNSVIEKLGNVGNKVTDQNLINLFKKHAMTEGQNYDFNFDGGFGGPIPFISKELGDMTFYLSNITARTSYIEPREKDYDLNTNTMLVLKSNITETMNLKITGSYNFHDGMSPTHGGDSEVPSLQSTLGLVNTTAMGVNGLDRGAFLPEDNIALLTGAGWGTAYGPPMWWYITDVPNWKQTNYLIAANLTHALSSETYYDATVSYQKMIDDINPTDTRNPEVLYRLAGAIPLTEMPLGRRILPIDVAVDTVDGFIFDQFYNIPGLNDRFGGKGGVLVDNSVTEQFRAKVNFGSQINKANFVKFGAELFYMNLDNKRYGYWQNTGSLYEYNMQVKPFTVGAYLQDEITYEEMVLNIGLRADYYSEASGLKWPTGRPFDKVAFGYPPTDPPNWLGTLQSGRSIIWEKWNALDQQYIAAGETPLLQPVKSHFALSPRLGISFPITERTKFYFNYGHFRSLPAFSEMYMYNVRYGNSKGGLYNLGNPNLEPSLTIQYELGLDYNLLDSYLIHIAGYYKDISGEVRTISYVPKAGQGNFDYRTNDAYRDIEGVELQITKSVGDIFTGWVRGQYVYASSGFSGRRRVYEDPASDINPDLVNYYQDPTRPDPVPQLSANLTFKSPNDWGYFLGDWRMSLLPDWRGGQIFRYNPRGLDVNNEFHWPSIWMVNLGLSKTFDLGYVNATVTLNVRNLFNTKVFNYNYAFATGLGTTNSPGSDLKDYMSSLHLTEFKDSYYDAIRAEKGVNGKTADAYLYPGYVRSDGTTVGEDKVGDMRSTDKPDINDPNVDIFMYGNPRSLWFGLKIDF